MKNLKKKIGGAREKTWEETILNGLIEFDGLPNNTHLINGLNGYYWVTHLYPYAKTQDTHTHLFVGGYG